MGTLLEVTNVSKNFSGLRAVADVSFAVPQGAVFAVIGPNGAGKTTLFSCTNPTRRRRCAARTKCFGNSICSTSAGISPGR